MKFKDIVGHQDIKEFLIQSYKNNRVSHAYLFFGTVGVGKLALAIAFAQYLSCSNKKESDSCGECPSCHKYEKLIHPDLHFVFPVTDEISEEYIKEWTEYVLKDPYFSYTDWILHLQKATSKKQQGLIRVKEAANIIKKLSYKAYESFYKIMIIWLPELMNDETANKILKLLEEPPDETVFILVSDNRQKIISTIISRTQPVKILGIENSEIEKELIRKYQIDETLAQDIVVNCNGSLLEARKKIIDNENNEASEINFKLYKELINILITKDIKAIIKWANEISSLGIERQKNVLDYFLKYSREIFVFNIKQYLSFLTKAEKEFAVNFGSYINEKNIFKIYTILNNAIYHLERNANEKILFTDLAFRLLKIIG